MRELDLLIGAGLLALLSAGLFLLSRLAARSSRILSSLLALTVFMLSVGYAIGMHGRIWMAQLIPSTGVIVLSNWLPLGSAVLMGTVAGQPNVPVWRRWAVVGMLAGLAWFTVAYDVLAPAPQPAEPVFFRGFPLQTTSASCSACSAAALLMDHGIAAGEREMMELCLTRSGGTPELGLFRGVKLKTDGTTWRTQVIHGDVTMLRQLDSHPVLLLVTAEYVPGARHNGWWGSRRADHAVLLYGFADDGMVEIGDPGSGRVRWSLDALESRWGGDGLCLVVRETRQETDSISRRATAEHSSQ